LLPSVFQKVLTHAQRKNMTEKQFLMSKTKQSLKLFPQVPDKAQTFGQGTLAEGEGSVQLTSSLRLLVL
jgi:hypothetical protein